MPRKPNPSGHKSKRGRPFSSDRLYAESLGINMRKLVRLGGRVHVEAMPDDARALILGIKNTGRSREYVNGGLAPRGYEKLKRGLDTQAKNNVAELVSVG